MAVRYCRTGRDRRWRVLTIGWAAILVFSAGCPSTARAATAQRQFRPWTVTVGMSFLRHAGITTRSSDGATDLAVDLGIAQPVGRKIVIELGGSVSTPWDDFGSSSIFAARAQVRLYPTLGRSQSDHVFFLLGTMLVVSDHESRGSRTGGGPELGLGTDIFVGESATIYVQVSAAALFMSEGSTLTNAGCMLDSYPFGSGFLRLAVGTRLGL